MDLMEIQGEQLVTKQYLDMRLTEVQAEIERLELRLTIKLGALMALAVGIVTALLKLR
jgi:hypothetical protein